MVENLALQYVFSCVRQLATNKFHRAGLKKGGAAKGELTLAIFELANCFRHGWGVTKDPAAAKQVSLGSKVLRSDGIELLTNSVL